VGFKFIDHRRKEEKDKMPRGLDVSLPEELQPAVLEPAMIVDWLAREEGRDMEEELPEEEKKYIVDNASTLRFLF